MSRPLRIDDTTSPISLKEMSNTDIDYITHRVLVQFASTQSGSGTINLTGTGTIIGTFDDTSRPYTIGQHPIGTNITTNTVTMYQDRTTSSPAPTRPIAWNGTDAQETSDSDLNSIVISRAATQLTTTGIGSYQLSTSVPTGGTWISIDTFTDTSASGNQTYTLYRKTNDTAPTVARPLKTVTGGLREMTDAEINSLTDNLREYIRTTGIGYYALQSTAPTTGTWLNTGTATDIRNNAANRSYTRFFSGFAGGNFTGRTLLSSTSTISTKTLWVRQS